METTVSSKGRIVLPAALRRRDRIRPGERFRVERVASGRYRLVRIPAGTNRGLVDALLACPVKGFFVPMESGPRVEAGESAFSPRRAASS
jgi:AbrB family looped-hinge helix DNA binding protein